MKTRAAVLRDMGKDWEVIEMDLDPPVPLRRPPAHR